MAAARFTWHDLMTHDPERALAFYGSLFGWTVRDEDLGELGPYARMCDGDGEFAGLVALGADPLPSHWMPYLPVPDVSRAAARVIELGGRVHYGPFEMAGSRFAVAEDDQGAWFSLVDGGLSADNGDRIVDHLLITGDVGRADRFWAALAGWSDAHAMVGPGRPHWRVVFRVDDPTAAARLALELAGALVEPPGMRADPRIALTDPTGAVFMVGPTELPASA